MNAPVLRATRRDAIATGVITAVSAVAIAGAWFTADIRGAHLDSADTPVTEAPAPAKLPTSVDEAFRAENKNTAGIARPLAAAGLTIATSDSGARALNADGEQVWEYTRDEDPLCSAGVAWGKVVLAFKTGRGCGDVVSLDAATGTYADTRSANNSESVVAVSSNDRVGTVSNERVELWRSDLVRTVEYGNVEAKQEAEHQPHEECTIGSALTRTELLAVTDSCPEDPESTFLRLQKTSPEDSRKPEITKDITIDGSGARLVAVGQNAAAVYIPGESPRIEAYDTSGKKISSTKVEPAPELVDSPSPYAPATADLPHHMTWFDGNRLYLFNPATLQVERVVEDALGTGIGLGDRLVVPTRDGLAEVDWATGKIRRTVKVDREGYTGPVHLQRAGEVLVEQRGDEVIGLR